MVTANVATERRRPDPMGVPWAGGTRGIGACLEEIKRSA